MHKFNYSLFPSNRTNKWLLIVKTTLESGKHYTSTYDVMALSPASAKRRANQRIARERMHWNPVGPGFRAEVIDPGWKTR